MITHKNPAPIPPARTVLIGARGFIGAAIRKELERKGIPLLALGSAELNLAEAGAGEKLAVQLKPDDVVVMLAALTPDKGKDVATLMKNLAMMQSVCSALEKIGCAHFTYFSSDAVYDVAVACVTDDTPAAPQDLYGVMHLAREVMARSLAGIPTLVLRPSIVYGAGDTHNSYGPNRFRRMAAKDGKITLFGGGEEMRDHVYIDDVAALTVRCLLHRSVGTILVATGVSTSFADVAALVAGAFEKKVEVLPTARANPITYRHYDPTALVKAFPDFRFTPLEQGIARAHREGQPTS